MGEAEHTQLFSFQGLEIMALQQADKPQARQSQPCYLLYFIRLPAAKHRKLKATHRSQSEAPSDLRQNLSPFPPPSLSCKKLALSNWLLNFCREPNCSSCQYPRGK